MTEDIMVPASSGYILLTMSDGGEVTRWPLAGWDISPDGLPVGMLTLIGQSRVCAYQAADGKVHHIKCNYAMAPDEGFASEAEWLIWARASQGQAGGEPHALP
jgi:hypothetical protein